MNASTARDILIIAAMVAGTVLTRFLPFLIFPEGKDTPRFIDYLSSTLPFATIGLLVVYCLRDIHPTAYSFGIPELLAVAVIVLLHRWKGNSLLSIGIGTILYMILVQVVF